ncbi:hypothetical protein PoB_004526100 [Plakobranchus ocellatus]|uniref:Uncharacterized protein n=1 Tax=Plakobranchus ocellatus TaxID=259542 RepID=A0AAV4BEB2_9GAST|nr:hypothetical protein PoB_004526100 [Plakobranchus ocellatus]
MGREVREEIKRGAEGLTKSKGQERKGKKRKIDRDRGGKAQYFSRSIVCSVTLRVGWQEKSKEQSTGQPMRNITDDGVPYTYTSLNPATNPKTKKV